MKRFVGAGFYLLILIFFSCANGDRTEPENSFVSKGQYDNEGYEVGKWQVFDKADNHVMEEGNFIKGVRTGEWRYYTQPADTIKWVAFSDKSGNIRTNVPDFLKLAEEDENLIRFSNADSSRLFNLVIGKGYTTDTTSLEAYKKMIYDDLANRAVIILDSATNYIKTSEGNQYLFSSVFGSIEQPKQDFILLNIAGKVDKRLIEVSLRCDKEYDSKARKIFFSVLPNLFVGSRRFISSKDVITTLRGDVK